MGRPGLTRRRPRPIAGPTARGAGLVLVVIGLVVAAIVTDTPLLLPLPVAMAVPLLVAPFVAARRAGRAADGISLFLHAAPPLAEVGQPVVVTLTVANHSGSSSPRLGLTPPGGRWRTRDADRTGPEPRRPSLAPTQLVPLAAPRPRNSAAHRFGAPTAERGVQVLGPLATWAADPFGLFAAPGPVTPELTVVVSPVADHSLRWRPVVAPDGAAARERALSGGGVGEILGIRPYAPGDRLSLLHWPTRARFGTWYVREFAPEDGGMTTVVVDDRAGVHRRSDFEALVAAALGLLERAILEGGEVELAMVTGRRLLIGSGPPALDRARAELAGLQPRRSTAATPLPVRGTIVTTGTGAQRLPDGVDRSQVVTAG